MNSQRGGLDAGPGLRLWRLWQALGLVLVLIIIQQSLTANPYAPPLFDWPGSDKLGHLLAYGVLAGWYFQLYRDTARRWRVALACVALGAALEILQPLVGGRHAEWADLQADALGVGLAWLLSRGTVLRVLPWLDGVLARPRA